MPLFALMNQAFGTDAAVIKYSPNTDETAGIVKQANPPAGGCLWYLNSLSLSDIEQAVLGKRDLRIVAKGVIQRQ